MWVPVHIAVRIQHGGDQPQTTKPKPIKPIKPNKPNKPNKPKPRRLIPIKEVSMYRWWEQDTDTNNFQEDSKQVTHAIYHRQNVPIPMAINGLTPMQAYCGHAIDRVNDVIVAHSIVFDPERPTPVNNKNFRLACFTPDFTLLMLLDILQLDERKKKKMTWYFDLSAKANIKPLCQRDEWNKDLTDLKYFDLTTKKIDEDLPNEIPDLIVFDTCEVYKTPHSSDAKYDSMGERTFDAFEKMTLHFTKLARWHNTCNIQFVNLVDHFAGGYRSYLFANSNKWPVDKLTINIMVCDTCGRQSSPYDYYNLSNFKSEAIFI